MNALGNAAAYGLRVPAWKRSLHLAPPFLLDDYMPRVRNPQYTGRCILTKRHTSI